MKILHDTNSRKDADTQNACSDQEAFSGVVRLYYEDLYKYAVKFTKGAEEAKDHVNEFFVQVWEKRCLFLSSKQPKNYFLSSFKNFLKRRLSTLQRDKNNEFLYVSAMEDKELPYEDYILANQQESDTKQSLQNAISRLPARQKELVQLKFYEHLTCEEIAEKTSLEIRTVYNKLHEAIKSLRKSDTIRHLKKTMFFFL